MSLRHFIREILGSQAELERLGRAIEDLVILYLLFSSVWSLCRVVGNALFWMGVG